MHQKDHLKSYLIVGQGIAGSVLAWQLLKAGCQVTIVDSHHQESSTIVSAGMVNPITGQRLTITPQFDLFYSQAMTTYNEISTELKKIFFIPKAIIRVLRSHDELTRCHNLKSLSEAKPYISEILKPGHYGTAIHAPFGTLTIAQGGYLQTQIFLTDLRKYFADKNMLINKHLSYDDLTLTTDYVEYQSQKFDAVIFCEGFKAKNNPWFNHLRYNFVKGEILKIAFEPNSLPDAIICQQQWCLPTADGSFLAGSTYDRTNIDTKVTQEGESTIIEGLNHFIPSKIRVIERFAGVRPAMLDQKPVFSMHPSIPRVGIFNGFGSKGILMAPYYAHMFAQRILKG